MQLQRDPHHGKYVVKSYKPGELIINENVYSASVIVGKLELIDHWRPQSLKDLTAEDFNLILALHPQIVLIGTGPEQQFPDQAVLAPLINHQIGIEIMNTHAACRTFNVLMSEDRHVIAALFV